MSASDSEIVADVRRGNHEAFGILVQRHQRRLFGLALMMVREPDGAEDVAQETFVRAFTHLGQYDAQRPFYPWLAAIAVRLAQNWLRRHSRARHREGNALDTADEPAVSPNPLRALIANERDERLWRTVSSLSSGERTVVTLFYRDEMAVAEIAHVVGVSTGTIKTLLFRARRHLRERLGESLLREDVAS